jgi:hypothetical protein
MVDQGQSDGKKQRLQKILDQVTAALQMSLNKQDFTSAARAGVGKLFEECGGPVQLLNTLFETKEAQQDFVHDLYQSYPPKSDVEYCTSADIQCIPEKDVIPLDYSVLHVAALSFDTRASLKPPVELQLAKKILDFILADA